MDAMERVILLLTALYLLLLVWEKIRARRDRAKIAHVVYVNGTRGKSTTCRLIDAGLRAGGLRVFCKTTGTDPLVIDVRGEQKPIRRLGPSNIREQLATLHAAASQGAQALVCECMAIRPDLQRVTQREMLRADIGVITNVRRDHTDVMGETMEEICDALCGTAPEGGVLFTGETALADRMARRCAEMRCRFAQALPRGDEPEFDFAENIALALAVCEELGVPREMALSGMRAFRPDPYALGAYRFGGGVFINGFSINDADSIERVYDALHARLNLDANCLTLLVNNRFDRGARTRDMALVCQRLRPARVLACGAGVSYLRRRLRALCPQAEFSALRSAREWTAASVARGETVFAVGNLAGMGRKLLEQAEKEGERIV